MTAKPVIKEPIKEEKDQELADEEADKVPDMPGTACFLDHNKKS